jgi:hypothetical protein
VLRPDATRRLTCDSVVVELRGFEPLTPCMPLMRGRFTSPCSASPTHATEQVKGAAVGWVVGRREVACSAVSGKFLARTLHAHLLHERQRHRSAASAASDWHLGALPLSSTWYG